MMKSCILATVLLATASCESWISVEPDDRLTEDMVFSSQKGFLQALNGIHNLSKRKIKNALQIVLEALMINQR